MDKAEILALLNEVLPELLKPTVDTLLSDVMSFMAESVTPLSDRIAELSQPKETPTEQPKEQSDSSDPMVARVKLLEDKLAQAAEKEAKQEAAAQDLRFSNSLNGELDKLSPLHKNIVQEILSNRIRKDVVEKDGQWLTKDGKTLSETVKNFFDSPEGQHFLPTNHQNGVGASESGAPKAGEKVDMESAIMAAFL